MSEQNLTKLLNEEIIGFSPKHGIKYIEKLGYKNATEIYREWRYDYVRNFDESIIPGGETHTPKRRNLPKDIVDEMLKLYMDGMYPKEIAKRMGINYSTVRTRLCHARREKGVKKHD